MSAGGEAGGTSSSIVLAALAVSLLVSGLRFWNMGDLSLTRKLLECGALFLFSFVMFAALFNLLSSFLEKGSSGYSGTYRYDTTTSDMAPEDLMHIESELPEAENPEVEGVKAKPPEELADALRGLSGRDEK